MGLFGLDANKSTSSLTQAQVTSQYGTAIGANIGKGSAASNASGTTTIGGGVKLGKNSNLVINNTNTQLENSILEGLTNISSFLAGGGSSGGEGGGSSGGIGGLLGGSSSKGGGGGRSGTGGGVEGGNIAITAPAHDLIGELEGNQSTNSNASTALLDQLNGGGTSDINDVSHPHNGGFNFSPNSGGDTTTQGSGNKTGSIVTGIVIAVVTAVVVGFAVKKLKLA